MLHDGFHMPLFLKWTDIIIFLVGLMTSLQLIPSTEDSVPQPLCEESENTTYCMKVNALNYETRICHN